MPKPKSKAQAAYLGGIAGGAIHNPHLSMTEAHNMLRGAKVKALPAKTRQKRGRR